MQTLVHFLPCLRFDVKSNMLPLFLNSSPMEGALTGTQVFVLWVGRH